MSDTSLPRFDHGPLAGQLKKYVFPGGYPVFYLTADSLDNLCPDCAQQYEDSGGKLEISLINWEDPMLFCANCQEKIESAYAEEED